MPVPRFRIQSVMIATAVLALDLAYLAWAEQHAQSANTLSEWFGVHVLLAYVVLGFMLWRTIRRR